MISVSALTAEAEAAQHSQLLQAGHLVVATPGRIAQVPLAPSPPFLSGLRFLEEGLSASCKVQVRHALKKVGSLGRL